MLSERTIIQDIRIIPEAGTVEVCRAVQIVQVEGEETIVRSSTPHRAAYPTGDLPADVAALIAGALPA